MPANRGTGDYYAFPDLATLTVADPAEHPRLPLGKDGPATGARVEVLGFSTATPEQDLLPDSLLVTVAGDPAVPCVSLVTRWCPASAAARCSTVSINAGITSR